MRATSPLKGLAHNLSLTLFCLSLTVSLATGAPPEPPQAAPTQAAPTQAAPTQAQPAEASPLPGTDVMSLSAPQREALTALMKEGPCPCDPKSTLFVCIQAKTCPAATDLASFGVQKFKEGLGKEQVIEAVINKYIEDFVPPATFELKGMAVKGPQEAPITIVEFADFECPHCALMSETIRQLVKAYPKEVRVFFKQFPLPMHQLAAVASKATLAAQRQGAFWPMHDLIFNQQRALSNESFEQFAQQLGLNIERFKADMSDPELDRLIERDKQEGLQAGAQVTR
jgi:hypothetical protein